MSESYVQELCAQIVSSMASYSLSLTFAKRYLTKTNSITEHCKLSIIFKFLFFQYHIRYEKKRGFANSGYQQMINDKEK